MILETMRHASMKVKSVMLHWKNKIVVLLFYIYYRNRCKSIVLLLLKEETIVLKCYQRESLIFMEINQYFNQKRLAFVQEIEVIITRN